MARRTKTTEESAPSERAAELRKELIKDMSHDLTLQEAAYAMNVSSMTARQYIATGRLQGAYRAVRTWRVPIESVREAVKQRDDANQTQITVPQRRTSRKNTIPSQNHHSTEQSELVTIGS